MSLTGAQQEAVAARGNVLVVAGAGTGKTRTLVERCLDCLVTERPRASLEEILVVTFTEAAAAEMRQRIRARIEEELARNPGDMHWQEQLALFETAHIGTIHSFCFELVRAHFYELELDPQLTILPEEEARLLAEETLDEIFQAHYAGKGSAAETVRQLIQAQAKGSDQPIRALVLRLHKYSQSLPNPRGWLLRQSEIFANPDPALWRGWLAEALSDWRQRAVPELAKSRAANPVAEECFNIFTALPAAPSPSQSAAALAAVLAAVQACPNGKKKYWVRPLQDFFEESRFLASLMPTEGQPEPLQQDWDWVRGQIAVLLGLAGEFGAAFTEAKRELGMLDFQDLEQYALRLLWDGKTDRPSSIAQEWRRQLRFIFVDEYQDINAAQDTIIQALSREGNGANRFLVGDVKQSIYRFRLANPHIFQSYVENWRNGQGRVIPLQDNFRSRQGILDFVNSVAEQLMHRELGGIDYDEQARLRFGERTPPPDALRDASPVVELQIRIKGGGREEDGEELDSDFAELEEAAKEARAVALRLLALRASRDQVWDEEEGQYRPVEWRDISILLRAPSNKAESYAKEFARLDVPLQVARGGFYESLEIADLLSLLQVLDNPLQDLPLLALLRSPLVGLTLDELATIRLVARHTTFWTALLRWKEMNGPQTTVHSPQTTVPRPQSTDHSPQTTVHSPQTTVHSPQSTDHSPQSTASTLHEKLSLLFERFARWRRLARQVALSRCLETILAETQYADWVATQPRGEQRCANLKRLLLLAQRFDQLQRQGLFRFLRFIEAQRRAETEPELTAVSTENAVRLMSIHQSKGLEFPVVVLADLGKSFNEADLRAEIILDERYGLCPQVKPPHTGKRYPSLPHWLAARQQKRELLGEELRLLYVAMTRAKERLILSASITRQSFDTVWSPESEAPEPCAHKARSFADWVGAWFRRNIPAPVPLEGHKALVSWAVQDDRALASTPANGSPAEATCPSPREVDLGVWSDLEQRFDRLYPFSTSTRLPAKTSVSTLRQRALPAGHKEAEVTPASLLQRRPSGAPTSLPAKSGQGSVARIQAPAVDIGIAHHQFLQLVALGRTDTEEHLMQEGERLVRQGAFQREDLQLLDFRAIAAFWSSSLGRRIRQQSAWVKRELPFTFRLGAAELAVLTGDTPEAVAPDDFVVVQGIADLAVILPEEIWLVDFKTDQITADEPLAGKGYEQQLRLYARGLSLIFNRPVTEAWLHFLSADKSVRVALE